MSIDGSQFFWMISVGVLLISFCSLYCIFVSRNILRIIIALELFAKGITLFLALIGFLTGRLGVIQSFIITVIVLEAVLVAVGAGIAVASFRKHGTLDVRELATLKG